MSRVPDGHSDPGPIHHTARPRRARAPWSRPEPGGPARRGTEAVGWYCRACRLDAGPFAEAEASLLARLHDQVMRHPAGTTVRLAG